jgi:hypothetical protein
MTQRQGGTSVLPERDHVDQPVALREAEEATARVAELRGNRPPMLLIAVVAAALIALAIAAALIASNPEPADVTPQERPNAVAEPIGSDQHLLNQAARVRGEDDNLSGSDLHLLNQAARVDSQASPTLGSDRHLENQAARPVPDAG